MFKTGLVTSPRRKPRSTDPSKQSRTSAPRKNTKLTGERSEAAFLARAADMGFGVAKPWGDSRRYDFILDNGECLHRVQVKCTESIRARAYETRATYTTGKGRAVYTKKDIDFIAAHVVPLDIWYIIPVEVCTPAPMLRFYPQRQAKIMRLEPYREAWTLVLPKQSNHVMDLHASADENFDIVNASAPEELLGLFRHLCRKTPTTKVPQSLAPWPIPSLKILVPRQGKHILPK